MHIRYHVVSLSLARVKSICLLLTKNGNTSSELLYHCGDCKVCVEIYAIYRAGKLSLFYKIFLHVCVCVSVFDVCALLYLLHHRVPHTSHVMPNFF